MIRAVKVPRWCQRTHAVYDANKLIAAQDLERPGCIRQSMHAAYLGLSVAALLALDACAGHSARHVGAFVARRVSTCYHTAARVNSIRCMWPRIAY
jgi:hypothetical protein